MLNLLVIPRLLRIDKIHKIKFISSIFNSVIFTLKYLNGSFEKSTRRKPALRVQLDAHLTGD